VTVDPFGESAHRSLMEALAASGDYAGATLLYRELRLRLHRELNTEPAAETTGLFQRLREEAPRRAASPHELHSFLPHPAATFTFLFTDIVGDARLWEEDRQAMQALRDSHDALLRRVIEAHRGRIFKLVGDGIRAAFADASVALRAAV